MSSFDSAMRYLLGIADLIGAHLALGPQVEVVLVELAEELPAVYIEAALQLGVGEPCRRLAGQEAYDSLVERVGGREGVRPVVLGSSARLFTSSLRPASPCASKRARASR